MVVTQYGKPSMVILSAAEYQRLNAGPDEFVDLVDLRPVSRLKPGVWTFGVLPTEIFDEIRAKLRLILQRRRRSVRSE